MRHLSQRDLDRSRAFDAACHDFHRLAVPLSKTSDGLSSHERVQRVAADRAERVLLDAWAVLNAHPLHAKTFSLNTRFLRWVTNYDFHATSSVLGLERVGELLAWLRHAPWIRTQPQALHAPFLSVRVDDPIFGPPLDRPTFVFVPPLGHRSMTQAFIDRALIPLLTSYRAAFPTHVPSSADARAWWTRVLRVAPLRLPNTVIGFQWAEILHRVANVQRPLSTTERLIERCARDLQRFPIDSESEQRPYALTVAPGSWTVVHGASLTDAAHRWVWERLSHPEHRTHAGALGLLATVRGVALPDVLASIPCPSDPLP